MARLMPVRNLFHLEQISDIKCFHSLPSKSPTWNFKPTCILYVPICKLLPTIRHQTCSFVWTHVQFWPLQSVLFVTRYDFFQAENTLERRPEYLIFFLTSKLSKIQWIKMKFGHREQYRCGVRNKVKRPNFGHRGFFIKKWISRQKPPSFMV